MFSFILAIHFFILLSLANGMTSVDIAKRGQMEMTLVRPPELCKMEERFVIYFSLSSMCMLVD